MAEYEFVPVFVLQAHSVDFGLSFLLFLVFNDREWVTQEGKKERDKEKKVGRRVGRTGE